MKTLGTIAFSFGLLLIGSTVYAQSDGLTFTAFHSDITINKDSSISVVETITADFSTEHHGIFRDIPFAYTTDKGETASIPIEVKSVKQDGSTAKVQKSTSDGVLDLKIGDPNTTLTGEHVYEITYTALAATNFFSDHDELYWNITGADWKAPLHNISATVHLPSSYAKDQIQTTCFTGALRSTEKNCTKASDESTATFTADTFLTVVVGWPVGIVIKPANYDELRAKGSSVPLFNSQFLHGFGLVVNIFLPLLALGFMFQRWWTRGRDPGQHRTIVAQYDPPDNVRPAELYAIMHERNSSKALTATLVDLAVRGYLKIIETEKAGLLGLGHSKEYTLRSLKAVDDKLKPFEKDLLETLFDEHLFPASDPDLHVSDLKKRHYTSDPFAPIFGRIISQITKEKYFSANPSTVRIVTLVLGLLVAGAGGATFATPYVLPGLILAGLIVAAFAKAMPKRTAAGAQAAWQGHGFKLFLETAEKYRIQWQERENIFEKFLPYAMIFGVAERWAKALQPVMKAQPSWYQGAPGTQFNSLLLWSSLSSFSSHMSTSAFSAAAGGSSGFGGGGFSGGGGGGGGGGGW